MLTRKQFRESMAFYAVVVLAGLGLIFKSAGVGTGIAVTLVALGLFAITCVTNHVLVDQIDALKADKE